tara:strand:- start:189 stop:653 length:465 start_codon:yes stop_codon:yes gene_type:complete
MMPSKLNTTLHPSKSNPADTVLQVATTIVAKSLYDLAYKYKLLLLLLANQQQAIRAVFKRSWTDFCWSEHLKSATSSQLGRSKMPNSMFSYTCRSPPSGGLTSTPDKLDAEASVDRFKTGQPLLLHNFCSAQKYNRGVSLKTKILSKFVQLLFR